MTHEASIREDLRGRELEVSQVSSKTNKSFTLLFHRIFWRIFEDIEGVDIGRSSHRKENINVRRIVGGK